MATQHLATWARGLEYSDLPHDVVRAAVRSFYNWAGSAIGGSDHEATTIAVSQAHWKLMYCLTNRSTNP